MIHLSVRAAFKLSDLTFINSLKEFVFICPPHDPTAEQITAEKESGEITSNCAAEDGNRSKEYSPAQSKCIGKNKTGTERKDRPRDEKYRSQKVYTHERKQSRDGVFLEPAKECLDPLCDVSVCGRVYNNVDDNAQQEKADEYLLHPGLLSGNDCFGIFLNHRGIIIV